MSTSISGRNPSLWLSGLGRGIVGTLDGFSKRSQITFAKFWGNICKIFRERETQLLAVLDAAKVGYFDWDLRTQKIIWSWHHERLWGFAPGEFSGTYDAFKERIFPADLTDLEANLALCQKNHTQHNYEFRVIWPDGSVHWILGIGNYEYDELGNALRMRGLVQEITERKQATQLLQEKEARLRLMFEHAPLAVALFDRKICYLEASNRWCADYQLDPKKLSGRSHYEVFPEIDYRWKQIHQRALAGETLRAEEEQFVRADGRVQWLRWKVCPWYDEQGQVAGIAIFSEDITARKQAELAIKAKQIRLETIFTTIPDVLFEYDAQLIPVRANPAALNLICRSDLENFIRDQVIKQLRYRDLNDQPIQLERLPSSRALMYGEIVCDELCKVTTAAGADRIFAVSAVPVTIAGNRDGVFTWWRDITERHQLENQLRQYQQILETSSEMLAFIDPQFCYRIVNPAYAAFLNNTPTAMIGRQVSEIKGPEAYRQIESHLQATLAGTSQRFTFKYLDPTGKQHWLEVNQQPFRKNGSPQGIIACLHDITELWETQLALKSEHDLLEQRVAQRTAELTKLHERLLLATESGEIGVWEWDLNHDQVSWDEQMYVLYGLQAGSYTSSSVWLNQLHPDDKIEMKNAIANVLNGKQKFRLEFRITWPSGEIRHLAAYAYVIRDLNNVPQKMIGVNWDITELKVARERAEQLARAKGDFLAQMSHEIRSPLHGMLGLTELALNCPLDPTVREYLNQAQQAGQTLSLILNDILDQAKIDNGHLTLELKPFARDELLTTLRNLFLSTAQMKGLTLEIRVDPEIPPWLLGDELRLRQILINLIGNALKFTEHGGVTVKVIQLGCANDQVRLRWLIEDTGIGMDPATQEHLFEPFTQGDDSISRRFGGTGLGLSISRGLAQLMGAELTLTSTLGVGSVFTLELNLNLAQPPLIVTATTEYNLNLQGKHILVAEDQVINQRLISEMLRLLGVIVTLANNGCEALHHLTISTFDAILMDIQMPDMDGLTATRKIRANPELTSLPIIALTAGVTALERARIAACGINDLLPKPFTLDSLQIILRRWIKNTSKTESQNKEPKSTPELVIPKATTPQTITLIGFNLQTLNQVARNTEQMLMLLNEFARSIRDQADDIKNFLIQNDFAEARRRIHRLKGVAGNFGATDLYSATIALENILQQPETDWAPALQNLLTAHNQALTSIAGLSN